MEDVPIRYSNLGVARCSGCGMKLIIKGEGTIHLKPICVTWRNYLNLIAPKCKFCGGDLIFSDVVQWKGKGITYLYFCKKCNKINEIERWRR